MSATLQEARLAKFARRKLTNQVALVLSLAAMAFGLFWLFWILFETIRLMLSAQVYDVMAATSTALLRASPTCTEDVRRLPALVCFTPGMAARSAALKSFLLRNLYRHPQVAEKSQAAQIVVCELFQIYIESPAQMPREHMERFASADLTYASGIKPERVVADYIAGMTDRFALKEHERLKGRAVFS